MSFLYNNEGTNMMTHMNMCTYRVCIDVSYTNFVKNDDKIQLQL
jgi:hypothetical protein